MKVCPTCKRIFVSERDFLKNTSSWRLTSDDSLAFSCSCTTTVVLEPGSFAWFVPSKLMSEKAASVFDKLSQKESLPKVSAASTKLVQLLQTEKATTIEMVKVLKLDPMLAASILKAANGSRGFAEASVVQNLDQAINYLGRNSMAAMVSGASVASFKFKTQHYTKTHYWLEAYTCGYLAEALTRKYAMHLPKDLAYLAGTLTNVGKCMGAMLLPGEIDEVYLKVTKENITWSQAEQLLQAKDHVLLGEIATVFWGLPKECLEGINEHHRPLEIKKGTHTQKPTLGVICAFANQLTHLVLGQPGRIDTHILASCEKVFKVPGEKGMLRLADELKAVADRAQSEVQKMIAPPSAPRSAG